MMDEPVIISIFSLLIGYLCGNFLSGFFLGKQRNVDLRKKGSGNVGTTNTLRVLGKRAALITLFMDIMKSVVASWIVYALFQSICGEDVIRFYQMLGSFGAVLGHDFPFYMKFKGGKGIATSTGMIIAIFPQCLPLLLALFILIVAITRYVSLGSVVCAIAFFVEVIVMGQLGILSFPQKMLPGAYVIALLTAFLAVFRHRSNIARLFHGTENKISFTKTGEE